MKKNIFLVALWGFFFGAIFYTAPVLAGAETKNMTMEEAVAAANQELGIEYYYTPAQIPVNGVLKTMGLNRAIWDERQILVYGGPADIPAGEQDYDQGRYRYLGYTLYGDLMPDPDFREDHASQTLINNYAWQQRPWEPPLSLGQQEWDNKPENLPYIKAGLLEKYKDRPSLYRLDLKPKNATGDGEDWHTVTKILQPRTSVTPGLGRMWHNWNGGWWYITVFIPVETPPDLEVTELSNESPVYVGAQQTATVKYRNNGSQPQTFEAVFIAGEEVIGKGNITLAAGGSIAKSYQWTAPAALGEVTLKAMAEVLPEETDVTNNEKTVVVNVISPQPADLLARLDRTKQPEGKIGQTVTLRGWVKNLGHVEQTTDYTWWLPDTSKYDYKPSNLIRYKTVSVTLAPGEEKEVTLQYKIPDTNYTKNGDAIRYQLEVNSFRNKPADEPNWANNLPGPMYIKITKAGTDPVPPGSGSGLRPPVIVK